jgi:hypothetical protein
MKQDDDFYEVMPYTRGRPYRDDLLEDTNEYKERVKLAALEIEGRRTAILTLIFVVMASLIFVVVVIRGLQMMHDAAGL